MSNLTYSHMPQLETDRCILRLMTLDDYKDLFEFYSNEKHLKYLPFKHHNTIAETKRFIRSFFIENYKQGNIGHYAIVLKDNNKVIGNIGFNNIKPTDKEGEIGVCLNPKYTGNGIIHEILIEILRFGFSDLKLNRIYAIARAENNASINILKHYNFNYVGETIETLKSNSGIQNIKYETYDIYAKQYLKKSKKFIKK